MQGKYYGKILKFWMAVLNAGPTVTECFRGHFLVADVNIVSLAPPTV